ARAARRYEASGLKMTSASATRRDCTGLGFSVARVGVVDLPVFQLVGHVRLVRLPALIVVRVLVAAAVPHLFHESGRGVAEVHRHGFVARLLDELARGAVR